MIAGTIWTNLVSTLEKNPTLKKYVKRVFEGRRFDIEAESLPCLMLEPTLVSAPSRRVANTELQELNIDIFAFATNNYDKFPKAIVGDQNYKGILGVENDLRACLKASNTLGGSVYDINIDDTSLGLDEGNQYPVRGLVMPIRILYRQVDGV